MTPSVAVLLDVAIAPSEGQPYFSFFLQPKNKKTNIRFRSNCRNWGKLLNLGQISVRVQMMNPETFQFVIV